MFLEAACKEAQQRAEQSRREIAVLIDETGNYYTLDLCYVAGFNLQEVNHRLILTFKPSTQ